MHSLAGLGLGGSTQQQQQQPSLLQRGNLFSAQPSAAANVPATPVPPSLPVAMDAEFQGPGVPPSLPGYSLMPQAGGLGLCGACRRSGWAVEPPGPPVQGVTPVTPVTPDLMMCTPLCTAVAGGAAGGAYPAHAARAASCVCVCPAVLPVHAPFCTRARIRTHVRLRQHVILCKLIPYSCTWIWCFCLPAHQHKHMRILFEHQNFLSILHNHNTHHARVTHITDMPPRAPHTHFPQYTQTPHTQRAHTPAGPSQPT